jgi:hypothetical protein
MVRRTARTERIVKEPIDFLYLVHCYVVKVLVLILLLIEAYRIIDSQVHIGRFLWR